MPSDPVKTLQAFENLPDPQTKAELLERMTVAYEAAESLIAAHEEAAMTHPLTDSGWSAKDYLAHLTAWERGMVALLQKKDRFREMGVDETEIDINDHDAVNAAIYRQHANRPYPDILTAFHQTHEDLRSTLASLTDQDLQMAYRHYQPQAEGEYIHNPVMGWLAGNTYAHYAEHILELGRLLNTAG